MSMQERTPRLPRYRRHKPSGQAVVTLSGQDYYLGPYGTKASKTEYDRLTAEWLARHEGAWALWTIQRTTNL